MTDEELMEEMMDIRNPTIGIAGCGGFVGGACYYTFAQSSEHKVFGYDIVPEKTKDGKEETLSADIVFNCVPTPMDLQGNCYLGFVESVCEEVRKLRSDSIIVIKSTIKPGTTDMLNEKYGNVFFSPEFLTERRYIQDFIELPYQILAHHSKPGFMTDLGCRADLENFFASLMKQDILKAKEIIWLTAKQAEMVKYFRNCYLATRLSYCNEIKQICDKLGITYEIVAEIAGLDERVGNHYNKINHQNPGWGLSCFPKDINALIETAKSLDVKPLVLSSVWEKNLEVRKYRDWEDMKKCVVKDEDGET